MKSTNYQPSQEWIQLNQKLGSQHFVQELPSIEPKKKALAKINLQKCRDYENAIAHRINYTLETILYHFVGEIKRQKAKGLKFVKIEPVNHPKPVS